MCPHAPVACDHGRCVYSAVTGSGGNPAGVGGASGAGGATGGVKDGGDSTEGGHATVDGARLDVAASSACSACWADELCVAFYDGTCKPMSTACRKVSAQTRQSILVDHQSCFMKPTGDEICGNADGGMFRGCGAPPCLSEPLGYGA